VGREPVPFVGEQSVDRALPQSIAQDLHRILKEWPNPCSAKRWVKSWSLPSIRSRLPATISAVS
jgi:hypothetical protein